MQLEKLTKDIKDILEQVEQDEEMLLETYLELLKSRHILQADAVFEDYQKTVMESTDGRLTNDQISYYLINFGKALYLLQTAYARQGLASDLAAIHFDNSHAVAYTGAVNDEGKKLTREDKNAQATLTTVNEKLVDILYNRVTQAIDNRLRAVNVIMRTLETSATLNMSDAKLGRNQ